MTHKAGVFIAEALEIHSPSYPMEVIDFEGIDLGDLGIRRLCEMLSVNSEIKMLAAGIVSQSALLILAEYADKFAGLQALSFEEPKDECSKWNKEGMHKFVEGFRKSDVLLDVRANCSEANATFVSEILFCAEQNRKRAELKRHLEESQDFENSEHLFSCIM